MIVLTSFLLLLFFSIPVSAGNPKSDQWKSVGGVFLGGEMLLSDNIKFTTSWASNSYSRQKGLYWSGGFWDPPDKRKYSPWENTVKNSVAPRIGQITVQGPGNIGLFQRTKGAGIKLLNAKTKAGFTPCGSSLQWVVGKNTWHGTVNDINPGGEFWGYIPAPVDGEVVTLDVEAHMGSYDNAMGTGEVSFTAPQEVEYEVWFFPREGGKVIKVIKYGPKGEEIDITTGDKPCKDEKPKCEELKKTLSDYIRARNLTLESIGDFNKQVDVLSRHSAFNTGYLNEYQNNTLGDDPNWTAKNLTILKYGAGGGTVSYLYNKEKWKNQLNKSIQLQTQNLRKTDDEIAKVKREIQQRGCK
jgi:hypothetical protein